MAVKGVKSHFISSNPRPLMEVGYPLKAVAADKEILITPQDGDITEWTIHHDDQTSEKYYPEFDKVPRHGERDPILCDLIRITGTKTFKALYEDPFENIALQAFCEESGTKPGKLISYPGDVYRLQDSLPTTFFEGYTGKGGTIRWLNLADYEVKLNFLLKRTHWGVKLQRLTKSKTNELRNWSKLLRSKIINLLQGRPNPKWTKDYTETVYADTEKRSMKARSISLLNILKTIDGEFTQRILAFPNEFWTWEKYDLFVLDRLCILIDDAFYDGELHARAMDYTCKFTELKRDRKNFKMHAHLEKWTYFSKEGNYDKETPAWLRGKSILYSEVGKIINPMVRTQVIGILSQTRGSGCPPNLVVHQSKMKFLKTVSSRPEPLTPEKKAVIRETVSRVVNSLPDEYFTGLRTKARISVEAKACYEKTREQGGTIQAISEIVWDGMDGVRANIIDLDTGEKVAESKRDELTEGEYVFWRCLEVVLESDPEQLKNSVTMVKEPGKARTVTKGVAALKIVLDVVNKICSYPLTKVKSSRSGMSMDAHGWNLFQMFYEKHDGIKPFEVHKVLSDVKSGNSRMRTVEYRDVFTECTDFSEATDNMLFEVARIVSCKWMDRCGIPKILQKVVVRSTLQPSTIEFRGEGLFSDVGRPTLREGIREVTQERGVRMGDPLTKPILHIINICCRELGSLVPKRDFWESIVPGMVHELPPEVKTYAPIKEEEVRTKYGKPSYVSSWEPSKDTLRLNRMSGPTFQTKAESGLSGGLDATHDTRLPIERLGPKDFKPRRRPAHPKPGGGSTVSVVKSGVSV
jgi:hypothetical protein